MKLLLGQVSEVSQCKWVLCTRAHQSYLDIGLRSGRLWTCSQAPNHFHWCLINHYTIITCRTLKVCAPRNYLCLTWIHRPVYALNFQATYCVYVHFYFARKQISISIVAAWRTWVWGGVVDLKVELYRAWLGVGRATWVMAGGNTGAGKINKPVKVSGIVGVLCSVLNSLILLLY